MKEKRAFDTEEEARAELERIVETVHKPWKKEHRKPTRVYFENGKYYLTSKPSIYVYR
jgi:hypothetical protein